MLLKNTKSTTMPSAVLLKAREDGKKDVRMADNIREEEREDGPVIVYDEVVFVLSEDRTETAEDIEANFEAWWDYGSQPEEPTPTIEDRVRAIEDYLIGGLI